MIDRRESALWAAARRIAAGATTLAVTTLLAGCSGFWTAATSSSTTTTTTTTTLSSGTFYVLNQATAQIAAYLISSGTLEQISGSPYSLAQLGTPVCLAVAPSGNTLYVGMSNVGSGIYAYTIGTGGMLTIANGGSPISSDTPFAMQVSPGSGWLVDAVVTFSSQVQFHAIPLTSTGVPPPYANVPSATVNISSGTATVKQIALSPKGDYLFAALGSGGAVAIPFSPLNGVSPFGATSLSIPVANPNQQSVLSVAVDPSERLFYLGETNADSSGSTGGLLAYSYSSLASGTPTQITGSPVASGGLSPSAILPEASGNYVYVANGQGASSAGAIDWFPITASTSATAETTYAITTGSSIAAGIFPVGLAEDATDQFVLAVSTGGSTTSGNPDLEAYTMSSGALTSVIASTTGTDPVGASAVVALP